MISNLADCSIDGQALYGLYRRRYPVSAVTAMVQWSLQPTRRHPARGISSTTANHFPRPADHQPAFSSAKRPGTESGLQCRVADLPGGTGGMGTLVHCSVSMSDHRRKRAQTLPQIRRARRDRPGGIKSDGRVLLQLQHLATRQFRFGECASAESDRRTIILSQGIRGCMGTSSGQTALAVY
jgi:hypothetical protein